MMRGFVFIGMIGMVMMSSCATDALVNETREVPNHEWVFENTALFTAEVTDTLTPFNYFIQLRHSGNYAYRNLILYFKTYYPNNTYIVDTIDCPLAEVNGKWRGTGLGDLLDNRIMFKINQKFPLTGSYNFELQHAMRPDTIHEIYDVGLLIERAID